MSQPIGKFATATKSRLTPAEISLRRKPARRAVALFYAMLMLFSGFGSNARAQPDNDFIANLQIDPTSVTFADIASPGQVLSQNFSFSMSNTTFEEFVETATDINFDGESSNGLFTVSALDCSGELAEFEFGNCFVNIEFEAPIVESGGPVLFTDVFNVTYSSEGEGSFSTPVTLNALVESEAPDFVVAVLAASSTPASIDFGDVVLGSEERRELAITLTNVADNSDGQALSASNISLSLSETGVFDLLNQSCDGDSIEPGRSIQCGVTVLGSPVIEGPASADILVSFQDGTDGFGTASPSVPLQVFGISPLLPVVLSIEADPSVISFGAVEPGTTTEIPLSIEFRNPSDFTVPVTLALNDSAFSTVPLSCPDVVPGTSTCELNVSYSPSLAGANSDTLTLSYDDGVDGGVSQTLATLSGEAVEALEPEPAVLLVDGGETGSLDFGSVAVGDTKTLRLPLQIQNISGGEEFGTAATGFGFEVPGTEATGIGLTTSNSEFTIVSEDCPAALQPGVDVFCDVEVGYTPTSTGDDTGTLNLSYNNGFDEFPITIEASGLTGSGEEAPQPEAAVLAVSGIDNVLNFGTIVLGDTAVMISVSATIENTSDSELGSTATGLTLSTNNIAFTVTPTVCPDVTPTVSVGCDFEVSYDPSTVGDDEGALELTFDDGQGGSISLGLAALTGVAEEPEPAAATLEISSSESELDFGTVVIGTPAVTLPLTLQITNTSGGEVPGSVASALLLGVSNTAFSIEPANCPDVGPGATESCVVEVSYNPSTAGEDEGALELSFDDGQGGSVSVDVADLAGVAQEPEPDPEAASLEIVVSESELDFGTVVIGTPAVTLPLTLQITNTSGGEVPGSVATALLLGVSNTAFSVEPDNCPDGGRAQRRVVL